MCHFYTTFYGCRHDASSSFIECHLYTEHQRRIATGVPPTHPKLKLYLELCTQEEDSSETRPLCPTCLATFNERTTTAMTRTEDENSAVGKNAAAENGDVKALPEGAAARRAQEQSQAISRARKKMEMMMELEMRHEDGEAEEEEEAEERRAKRWEEAMRRRAEGFMLEMRGVVERRNGGAVGL